MTPLEALIHEEVRSHGPISFRRFMDLALYHPEHGYYMRGEDHFGREGDFYTNSQLQPVFGRLIAQQIARWREEMGSPEDFTVIELGAGRGETLAEVRKALPEARCLAVERTGGNIPEAFQGVVYSNEFFDALPVHLVERRSDGLIELLVVSQRGGFQWTPGQPAEPSATNYISRYAPGLAEGDHIEVNLTALDECERIAAALKRGYVLTIDYGYTAEEIAAGRRFPQGSLMAYERHQAKEDVLAKPGRRDITAHVNFTALEARGRELGLDSLGLRTQAQFLLALGETDNFAAALEAATDTKALHLRMQLKSLLFGMGETFRVLVQKKQTLYSEQRMASAAPQIPLDELAGRRFSFYPTIRNVEHNEWTLTKETWSEVLVANAASGLEIWIPRTCLGSIGNSDSPVLIVGLTRELEWKAGKVWPHQERLIKMPARKSPPMAADVIAGPQPASRESVAESRVGRFLFAALGVGLLACLFVVMYAFDSLRSPLDILFPPDTATTDQLYLGLVGADGYQDVLRKIGRPENEQWISKPADQIQFQVLSYSSRFYALILMGPGRQQARYIGAIHQPSRKMLDSVKLAGGGTTASMLNNLPAF